MSEAWVLRVGLVVGGNAGLGRDLGGTSSSARADANRLTFALNCAHVHEVSASMRSMLSLLRRRTVCVVEQRTKHVDE